MRSVDKFKKKKKNIITKGIGGTIIRQHNVVDEFDYSAKLTYGMLSMIERGEEFLMYFGHDLKQHQKCLVMGHMETLRDSSVGVYGLLKGLPKLENINTVSSIPLEWDKMMEFARKHYSHDYDVSGNEYLTDLLSVMDKYDWMKPIQMDECELINVDALVDWVEEG